MPYITSLPERGRENIKYFISWTKLVNTQSKKAVKRHLWVVEYTATTTLEYFHFSVKTLQSLISFQLLRHCVLSGRTQRAQTARK